MVSVWKSAGGVGAFQDSSVNSWALGEGLWKNWPPAPQPQSFPWGKTWERQQGWERGAVILEGERGRRNAGVVRRARKMPCGVQR